MRPVLALLVLVMAMSISGISSAMVGVAGDDCCADGGEKAPADEPSNVPHGCPPFCHACACSPTFAVPVSNAFVIVSLVQRTATNVARSQLPESPPLPGVFHPPR